jgi:hypothetical protein
VRIADDPLIVQVLKYEDERGEDDLRPPHCSGLEKLLPGLQLDTLTVFNRMAPRDSYATLDMLVHYSDTWKGLRFPSDTFSLLRYESEPGIGPSNHLYVSLNPPTGRTPSSSATDKLHNPQWWSIERLV